MRRLISTLGVKSFVVAAAACCVMGTVSAAQAAPYDSHCFAKRSVDASATDVVRYKEAEDTVNALSEEERQVALKEYERRNWILRMGENPWLDLKRNFLGNPENRKRLIISDGQGRFEDALTMAFLEEHAERQSRKTGSKYLYVSPEMKQLSRLRDEIRAAKGKPCNRNIIYLSN